MVFKILETKANEVIPMTAHWLSPCIEDTELTVQEDQGARSWWVRAQEERMWRETPTLTHVGRLPGPGEEPEERENTGTATWSVSTNMGLWAQYSEGSHLKREQLGLHHHPGST